MQESTPNDELKICKMFTTDPGEGDDDKFAQPATARQLQRNGEQVKQY